MLLAPTIISNSISYGCAFEPSLRIQMRTSLPIRVFSYTLYLYASFHWLMYTPWQIVPYDSWNRWKFGGWHAVSDFWFIYLRLFVKPPMAIGGEKRTVLFLETDTRLWGLNCFMDRLPRQDFIVTFVCFFVNKLDVHPGDAFKWIS